ncbi:MAG: DUF1292 domain-containing protein [Tissierellia bacterium]|nr:DUF1292 domain-containing protein [Tissierellia bacterium]
MNFEDEILDEFDEDEDVIILTLEDDSEIYCDVLFVFEVEGLETEYIALQVRDSEEIFLYGYVENEDYSFEIIPIEDEDELIKVSNVFEEIMEEQF